MARSHWKVLTVGAALTGLGAVGTGIALADDGGGEPPRTEPIAVTTTETGKAAQPGHRTGTDSRSGGTPTTDADDTPDGTPDGPDTDSPDAHTPDDPNDSPDNDDRDDNDDDRDDRNDRDGDDSADD